jgi:hypothetical protein
MKTPITIAPEVLDFSQLIRSGETVGWAEATAEPVFLTRMLDLSTRVHRPCATGARPLPGEVWHRELTFWVTRTYE